MYEMQEQNFCNMAVSKPGGIKNRGYKDTEQDIEVRTNINNKQKSDNAEGSNCMSTLLNQAARNSVKLLRRSLKFFLMQDKNQDA